MSNPRKNLPVVALVTPVSTKVLILGVNTLVVASVVITCVVISGIITLVVKTCAAKPTTVSIGNTALVISVIVLVYVAVVVVGRLLCKT